MKTYPLYFVATPIGNLDDMSDRAKQVLGMVDVVLCEDTRKTGLLLKHYGIESRLQSFHAHNEHKVLDGIIKKIKEGQSFALVSDAGTPAISDPGYLLLREAVREDIEFTVIPGASAFLSALLLSGFPTDRFIYHGFLPHKKGRKTQIEAWREESKTVVFYESPHRLLKCLEQMLEILGPEREIAVVREISKKFEEVIRGSIPEVLSVFNEKSIKGEFVLVLKGNEASS